jgi:hypothetical protein
LNAQRELVRESYRSYGGPGDGITAPISLVPPHRPGSLARPRLELRQLHAFVAVAEELHFGRAAARLHLAQSPLSRVIRKLEDGVGVALFVRNKRMVKLTRAGEVLLQSARELLLLAEIAVARLDTSSV